MKCFTVEAYAKEFWLPKHGNSEAEYEDASSIANNRERFAVADGATQSYLSGPWAKQLVRAFTGGKLSLSITPEELTPLQTRWQKIAHRRPLPWYAEEKANSGAFAAFVGLELLMENSGAGTQKTWRAAAVGDSCLVQMRGDEIIQAFPLTDSDSFGNNPNLLCSLPGANGNNSEFVAQYSGFWGCEDAFFLMTDALACWFFKEREQGNKPWILLRDVDSQGSVSFEQFIQNLRSSRQMKNDDVTLLRIDKLP
jgi:hypothetical protein